MVPKFNLTTINLTADLRTARADLGACDFGERDDAQLFAMLEIFRQIDPVQNHAAEPQIVIEAPTGKFLVRTGQGKLYLYNARDTTEPYAELTPEEIVAELERPAAAAPAAPADAAPIPPPAPHRGIAFTILIAGLALNGYTLYSAFYSESVNQKAPIVLLTEADGLGAHQREAVGIYATGTQPGDRVIVVGADGHVQFSEIGSAKSINNGTDTYRLGRHDQTLCLSTTDSGVIDLLNIDTVVYYRDTYKRR